jgi:hypothetical protein
LEGQTKSLRIVKGYLYSARLKLAQVVVACTWS